MLRGNITNIGPNQIWVMKNVLFDLDGVRPDREDWFKIASLFVDLVIVVPDDSPLPTDFNHSKLIASSIADAQLQLMRNPIPLFLVTESLDDTTKDTVAFSGNILRHYNLIRR